MSARRFGIPLSALSLTLMPACSGNSLIGEWNLVELEIDGEDYSGYLDGVSYTDGSGCTYTAKQSVVFSFDERDGDDFEGEYTQTYTYTYACPGEALESYSDNYEDDAEATQTGKGTYEIEADGLRLEIDCVLESDELDCEGEIYTEEATLVFERDE
jgi:hypothetical protein